MKLRDLLLIACLLVVKMECMTGPTGITAQVGPTGKLTNEEQAKILEEAIGWGDITTVQKILKDGFKPYREFLIITIPNTASSSNMEIPQMVLDATDIDVVKSAADDIFVRAQSDWLKKRGLAVVKLMLPYLSEQSLMGIKPEILSALDEETQNFIKWLQAGAPTQGLSTTQALNLAKTALMLRHIKAFETLLISIAHDRTLVNQLRDAANNLEDQQFAEQVRALIKRETGKPGFTQPNVKFSFK